MILRHWLPALLVLSSIAWVLHHTWRGVEPLIYRNANEEILADAAGVVAERRELFKDGKLDSNGQEELPRVEDPAYLFWQLQYPRDADGQLIKQGFLRTRLLPWYQGKMVDVWEHPLRHVIKDGHYTAISDGPDGLSGTADDMSSDTARDRATGDPRRKVQKKKKPAAKSG